MPPRKNQPALQRYREILLATFEYLLKKTAARVKFDGLDPDADFFQFMREQTEKHYEQGRLKHLEKRFHEMSAMPRLTGDMEFGKFIKEKTGYDLDIFENLQSRINDIIAQETIRNDDEYLDVIAMINLGQQAPDNEEKIERLINLRNDYQEKLTRIKYSARNKRINASIILSQVAEIYSPDKKRKLTIAETGAGVEDPQTEVSIHFENGNGRIFAVKGINLQINLYWKTNHTIVIETNKEHEPITDRFQQVQSLEDIVKIEYVESEHR